MSSSLSSSAIARRWDLGLPVHGLTLNRRGDVLAAPMGDGTVHLWPADDTADVPKIISVHDGVSLALVPDADDHGFLSGGDDGLVAVLDPDLDFATELTRAPNKAWVETVAGSSTGFRAFTVGKKLYLYDPEGNPVGDPALLPAHGLGLGFSPDGQHLAASHNNGVSVFTSNNWPAGGTVLPWQGAHQDVIWTPDSSILMTALREGALHGWRMEDKAEMQMQGYNAPIRSTGFTVENKYLMTSGADRIIGWPFTNGGPWDQRPLTLGGTDSRLVTRVAPHPKDPLVAAGYDDGMIVLAPLDGRMEIMILPPQGFNSHAITGLVWNAYGDCLFASQANQTLLLFTTKSIRSLV